MSTLDTAVISIPTVGTSVHWHSEQMNSRRQFESFCTPWRRVAESSRLPTVQYEWFAAAAALLAQEADLRGLALLRSGQPVAFAPLYRARFRGLRHLFLLGVQELHEPTDLVYQDQEALDHLVSALLHAGRPMSFGRMLADSPTIEAFTRLGRNRAMLISRPQSSCPYITLTPQWIEPESQLAAGRRSDLRRARRKAEQRGPVGFETFTPVLDNLEPLLDDALAIEARSWKGAAGTALLYDPPRHAFFRAYARSICASGALRICFLRIGDLRVAMQIAVQHGGGFWLLKIGYDEAFAACSSGSLLMRETIKYAAEQRLCTYEFLGCPAPWTEVWTRQDRPCVSLRVYPHSLRGLAALTQAAGRALYRRWKGK